jgi:hypothetical protein
MMRPISSRGPTFQFPQGTRYCEGEHWQQSIGIYTDRLSTKALRFAACVVVSGTAT